MFVDIAACDVAEANRRLTDKERASHGWHNPIAIAIERLQPGSRVVVTNDFIHIAHEPNTRMRMLTKTARDYLWAFRLGRAGPVDRICVSVD